MGLKKLYKRRKRRQLKQGRKGAPVHKLIGGRTGAKRSKQRQGLKDGLRRKAKD